MEHKSVQCYYHPDSIHQCPNLGHYKITFINTMTITYCKDCVLLILKDSYWTRQIVDSIPKNIINLLTVHRE